MGRSYAGILGPLAFVTEVARGVSRSAGTESTVMAAVAALFAFAVIGFVLGELAGWIVNDSVRSRLAAEIAAAKPKAAAAKPGVAADAAPLAANANAAKPNAAATAIKPNPQPVKPNTATARNAVASSAAAKPNVPAAAGATNKS
jgi:hypothetical protein